MTLLLFLKQIIDMLYDYRLPDYLMVAGVIVVTCYQIYLVRPKKIHVMLTDICIILLSVLSISAYIRGGICDFRVLSKILSSFLIYFVGRLCYERIAEGTYALALASYIVVYCNLVTRIMNVGFSTKTDAGIYYCGTDLGYAMILAIIFIAMYSKNGIMKFVTIFVACPYMIMCADAGVQQILMVVVYVVLLIYMAELAVKKRAFSDWILPIAIVGLILVEIALILPCIIGNSENPIISFIDRYVGNTANITSRYAVWGNIWTELGTKGTAGYLFGIGNNLAAHNQYMTILNIMGFSGIIIMFVFIISICALTIKAKDRKTYYVTAMLAIIFLGTCINVDGIEFTQISWFPMMYGGLVATAGSKKSEEKADA